MIRTLLLILLVSPLLATAQTLTDPSSCLKGLGVADGQMPTIEQLQKCAPQPPAGSLSAPSAPSSPATVSTSAVSTQSSSCPNLTRTLQKGSRGTDVTSLQSFLIQKGYLSSDSATGYFGSLTESAVQKFQCAQSVVCSGTPASTGYGLVGAKTRAAIQRSCSGTTTTTTNTTSSNTSNSSQSLIDQLNAQIKQLQERLAALSGSGSQTTQSTQSTQTTTQTTQTTTNATCSFNNQTVAHGASVTAYQSSSVASGQTCQSQTRTCSNGTLSGTYAAERCTVENTQQTSGSASCSLNGETIAHGASKIFYWRSSAGSSATCASAAQTRTCSNGTLSGSPAYGFSSCTPVAGETGCRAPRHYSYTLNADTVLQCTPTTRDVFSVSIPDTGNAIARAELTYKNQDSGQIYFWTSYVVVGDGKITYGQGDDLCPGASATKVSLGYGTLSTGNQVVRILGQSGAGSCTDGTVTVFAGGKLDVWVEDPSPQCQGKDVNMVSSYQTYGLEYKWLWTNWMQKIVELVVPESSGRTSMKILSAIEGSPTLTPNRQCGSESATLVAQVASSLTGLVDTKTAVVPAGEGMGHLVLSPEGTVTTAMNSALNSSHTLQLLAGSNFDNGYPVYSGGCCGDGKLGFVRLGGESSGVTMTAAQPTLSSGGSTIVSWSAPGTSSCALYFNGTYSYTFSTLTASASAFATGALTKSTSYELRCTAGSKTVVGSVLISVQ